MRGGGESSTGLQKILLMTMIPVFMSNDNNPLTREGGKEGEREGERAGEIKTTAC